MTAVVIALTGVLGLVIGSFLNVVIYRVPAGKSIVSPPSACPGCGATIRPADNIPVLSWLLLRGRCRECHSPISARYPLVELGTAVLFAVVAVWFGGPILAATTTTATVAAILVLLAYLYLAAITVALAMIDIDTQRLPNAIVLPSYLVVGALLAAAGIVGGDVDAIIRAAAGGGILFAFYFLLVMLYPKGMGFGDVKLAGVLGMGLGWLGWGSLIVGGFAAFLLGGLFAIVLLALRKAGRKSGIPFGPWMLAGAWLGVLFGERLWRGYLSLVGLA